MFDNDEWIEILLFLNSYTDYISKANLIICFIGLFANTFHFLVLTRKYMRKLSINTFLAAICFCDMTVMICNIILAAPYYFRIKLEGTPFECIPPISYWMMLFTKFIYSFFLFLQCCSIWYAVIMAVFRTVILKNLMNPKYNRLSQSRYGIRAVLLVTLIILPFWFLSFAATDIITLKVVWVAPKTCSNLPENYTQEQYAFEFTNVFNQNYEYENKMILLYQGLLFKLLPSAILPVATCLLLWEIGKAKKRVGAKVTESETESGTRRTKLVTFMTVSFLLTVLPLGLLYLAQVIVYDNITLTTILGIFTSIFQVLMVLNGTTHMLICFFLSSQYRKVAKKMLGGFR
ncbi:unnamed protein product [Caenorhabditis sp. 36 PRJEB53466]|nr:unnamed protein product [Caenorhabditis sp. 36 PRJEB53466]